MPGGMGTLDELFEALTLIQNKIINNFPIVIFDSVYHKELCHHIQRMVDITHIQKHAIKKFGLKKQEYKARWWLGEKNRL
jgi:predicted Rossmann-fold nucleotide-binding protein